jgi:hypothetical protein
MKRYNFKKAKQIIKASKNLSSASIGMHEDWFWTADKIWEDGKFLRKLPSNADGLNKKYVAYRKAGGGVLSAPKNLTSHLICGIYESNWATPCIQLIFNDGSEKMIPCFSGKNSGSMPFSLLGVLSGLVQDNITPLTK